MIIYIVFLVEQSVTDEGIISISDGCNDLETLCVSKCSRFSDAALVALGQSCHNLRCVGGRGEVVLYVTTSGYGYMS